MFDLTTEDYRAIDTQPAGCFLTPIDAATTAELDAQFRGLVASPQATELKVEGRSFSVPQSGTDARGAPIARFSFEELCGAARGRAEYAALATQFHTVFVDGIPKLDSDTGAEFRRLVSLVDILYDKKCLLYCTSEVPMPEIWDGPKFTSDDPVEFINVDELWAWRRTKAKLTEMASSKYASMAWLMRNHLVQQRATAL